MRVALINDGMYPYRADAGGVWAHRLVRGLPEHTFHLVTITDRAARGSVFYPPANTLTLTPVTLDGPALGSNRRRAALRSRRAATHAAVLICRSMLEDTPGSVAVFRSGLRHLSEGVDEHVHPMHGVPLAAVLFDAWRVAAASRRPAMAARPRATLPQPGPDDAWHAARLLERALRPLSAPLPLTDLNHAVDAGLSALVALSAKWRLRTPYVVTEHRTYLDAPLLGHARERPPVRAVLLRFFRALARLAYHEAGAIVEPTEPLRGWALDHGADRERTTLAPYGVDPHACAPLRREPAEPAIVWLGLERDLCAMVTALAEVRRAHRGARVLVAGPATPILGAPPSNVIAFLGPVSHRRSAYAIGQIVVLSAAHEAMPYALIEAMMCGRPTIIVDDGRADMVGMGAMTVPPNDPKALAAAIITLLADKALRQRLSTASAQRSRALFTLRAQLDRFREVYAQAARDARTDMPEPATAT